MPSFADFLKSIPYFSPLDTDEMQRICRETLELSFSSGEILFLEGEPCRGLYLVHSGRIRIFKTSPEGREQVLRIVKRGESFNDVPVFDGGPNPASAMALEPSEVYMFPKGTILSLFARCPQALAFLRDFATRLRHLTSLVEDLSFRSVVSRLARLLLELAVVQETTTPIPRLTQDEMAARVGTVRDVIGRALKTLEKAGAIRMERNRLYIVDPGMLKSIS